MQFDDAEIEAGRKLFAQACDFTRGVNTLSQLAEPDLPEVAFAGRSNVGKSSLVNALTGRKTLARTSNTPGRTQQLNFFDLGGRLALVDLPGHGYARASKSSIANWTKLVRDYLRGRVTLMRLCLLVDARHGLKPPDLELMDMLDEAAVTYQIILTKADKTPPKLIAATRKKVEAVIKDRAAASPFLLVTSSVKGEGVAELRALLAGMARPQ